MLERLNLAQTNRPIEVIRYWAAEGNLLLTPPYQRGDVWGPVRQRNLIRSVMLGIPIPSIIVNDRLAANSWYGKCWEGDYSMAVIDGKQRLTALLAFLEDRLEVPGEWWDMHGEPMVKYSYLSVLHQRQFKNYPLQFTEGRLRSLEEEKEVFDLVNFGGLAQGETDHD